MDILKPKNRKQYILLSFTILLIGIVFDDLTTYMALTEFPNRLAETNPSVVENINQNGIANGIILTELTFLKYYAGMVLAVLIIIMPFVIKFPEHLLPDETPRTYTYFIIASSLVAIGIGKGLAGISNFIMIINAAVT